MVMTRSRMLPLGTVAPAFSLPDAHGKTVSLGDFESAKATLVVFMCNHCPYVKHLRAALSELGRVCESKGVAMVGINSSDFEQYPDDTPERMRSEAQAHGYGFPYLVDEDQSVAKAYQAACTPDFFLFDADRKLVYRGQFDDSRPSNDADVTGKDLYAALEAVLAGEAVAEEQTPSIGCNIKWKPGNAPEWAGS
ncbi:MAG: thioredoxin family protein [Nannocystaceae bacterium]|nr:thioredoxin family protein [bacterium]